MATLNVFATSNENNSFDLNMISSTIIMRSGDDTRAYSLSPLTIPRIITVKNSCRFVFLLYRQSNMKN